MCYYSAITYFHRLHWLLLLQGGDFNLLCRESDRWKLRSVDANFTKSVNIDSLQVHDKSTFLAAEGYHFLKSSGFPVLLVRSSCRTFISYSIPTYTNQISERHRHLRKCEASSIRGRGPTTSLLPIWWKHQEVSQPLSELCCTSWRRNSASSAEMEGVQGCPRRRYFKLTYHFVAVSGSGSCISSTNLGRINMHQIGGFLEAVDTVNGAVQYIPVPEPYYQSYHG